jgi:hypothetical protein
MKPASLLTRILALTENDHLPRVRFRVRIANGTRLDAAIRRAKAALRRNHAEVR